MQTKTIYKKLPTDEEVAEWYSGNIDTDCSASSGIYKFRQWLEERQKGFDKPRLYMGELRELINDYLKADISIGRFLEILNEKIEP